MAKWTRHVKVSMYWIINLATGIATCLYKYETLSHHSHNMHRLHSKTQATMLQRVPVSEQKPWSSQHFCILLWKLEIKTQSLNYPYHSITVAGIYKYCSWDSLRYWSIYNYSCPYHNKHVAVTVYPSAVWHCTAWFQLSLKHWTGTLCAFHWLP